MWAPYPAGVTALTPQQFAQYSKIGVKRGFTDILIFYHMVFGIELKTRRGRLSKTRVGRTRRGSPIELIGQEDQFPKLLATGAFGKIEVARSVDDVCDLLDKWGIPRIGGKPWRVVLQRPSGPLLAETFAKRAASGGS